MKKLFFIVLLIPLGWLIYNMSFYNPWLTDFETAKMQSRESGRPILLYFSGSDWCGVCMKMKKELLESHTFKEYADDHLILVLADFPRMKKNRLDEKLTKQNESLAEQYNPSGSIPYIVLLNPEGNVLKDWMGYSNLKPEAFIDQIKKCHKSF